MVARSSVPGVKMAGLERTARLAGEAFGYEDMAFLARSRATDIGQSRKLWWLAASIAVIGLVALALR
ncbi:hypothetical protein FG93_03529 [Bosea sp. LC85]|uniref:hypothetical protein n=1 Tax=Bosea sp. LC85 TaxID=1502851 RepID=UPI0004E44A8C|nr:hypothetical protein [Bosea sp. LC85]KFC68907.1 hypothetical protein FG93_03529 [Bosea sp. LC85]